MTEKDIVTEIYKVYCKGEREGEPIAADLIVRADAPEFALGCARRYLNQRQPFLGIRIDDREQLSLAEMSPEERAFHAHPAIQATADDVKMVAFYENNPPPDPSSYKVIPVVRL